MHLLESTLDSGLVNLQTNTAVTGITKSSSGEFVVETARGFVRAKIIVHANNAYVGELLPEYKPSIIPWYVKEAHIAPRYANSNTDVLMQ